VTKQRFDAVVFDLDGTLIDTETSYRRAFFAAAATFGMHVTDGFYATLLGVATPERADLIRARFGADFPVGDFLAAYYVHRAAILPDPPPLCPGALDLLRTLPQPKAIATSASRRTAHRHLASAGLTSYFAHVVTRDDVPRGKPAPDSFRHATTLLGVEPARCLAIEDSPTGVAAAEAAGLHVLMVAATPPSSASRRCLAVVPDLWAAQEALRAAGPRPLAPTA